MQKTAVLVIGAPRSGTSLVSNVISELGFDFGNQNRFVDPKIHPWNPNFFELQTLNDLNDKLIRSFGYEYFDADWLPLKEHFDEGFVDYHRADITNFIRDEFNGSDLIGLKDPRFCFTLPLWLKTLRELRYEPRLVWVARPISACIRSNKIVDNSLLMRPERLVVSSVLAAAYMLEGEAYYFCDYNRLVEHPDEQVRQIASWLGLSFENIQAACQAIRPDLRHNMNQDGNELSLPLDQLSSRLLEKQLDSSHYISFRETLESYGYLEILKQRKQLISSLTSAIAEKDVHIDKMTDYANDLNVQVVALNAQVVALNSEISKIRESISWRITKPIRFIARKLNIS